MSGRLVARTCFVAAVALFAALPTLAAADAGRPALRDLNADVGLRAALIRSFFAEIKIELRYASTPAQGAEKEDLRYLIGVGRSF
jgi:hypothetical protein